MDSLGSYQSLLAAEDFTEADIVKRSTFRPMCGVYFLICNGVVVYVGKMLDHKLPGVMAVYNHAEYRDERYAAQRLWERELLRRRKKTPEV